MKLHKIDPTTGFPYPKRKRKIGRMAQLGKWHRKLRHRNAR